MDFPHPKTDNEVVVRPFMSPITFLPRVRHYVTISYFLSSLHSYTNRMDSMELFESNKFCLLSKNVRSFLPTFSYVPGLTPQIHTVRFLILKVGNRLLRSFPKTSSFTYLILHFNFGRWYFRLHYKCLHTFLYTQT